MKDRSNVTFLVTFIIAIITVIAIFAPRRRVSESPISTYEYRENIRILNDTIDALKKDIDRYKFEIKRIDFEREALKKELELIVKDNEKVDTELANGDLDSNIRFLSEFLSEEDTLGE